MKVTKATLESPRAHKKLNLLLAWKDPTRVEFTDNALRTLRAVPFDYSNPDLFETMKLITQFPSQSIQESLARRQDLPTDLQMRLIESQFSSVFRIIVSKEVPEYVLRKAFRRAISELPVTDFLYALMNNEQQPLWLLEDLYSYSFLHSNIVRSSHASPELLTKIARNTDSDTVLMRLADKTVLPTDVWLELLHKRGWLNGPEKDNFNSGPYGLSEAVLERIRKGDVELVPKAVQKEVKENE